MRKLFIESPGFTDWIKVHLEDDRLASLQRELSTDPEAGDVMPGCGGLRKIRIADSRRGKGKRGGIRIIYLHVAEVDVILLLDVYSKTDQQNLTNDQRRILKGMADIYKQTLIQWMGDSRKRKR
ncbi:MAG: type II toxin-antitoxin system RelE/ParE family toxin [Paludisphaera borealis]|uniref:type II toxin-antitoxin system RelE/ParE family toxin n=1 Tax=Paludisphaera borealis TaxID=1387353 RepID=UPI00283C9A1E|nr:type II toxin-antitoxin system RelE/ParE family toxin [Paludisphaera borealis]MDR3621090.1 type II toxin-antitoxin system RelE/ParE family toxin [Paludisphaera borealis]